MDLFSWAQTKLQEAAVLMGFVAVVNVSFLSPIVLTEDERYDVRLFIDEGFSSNMEELLDNSVHIGIEYSITIYTPDDRRVQFTIIKDARYDSLHDRYELHSFGPKQHMGSPVNRYASIKKEVENFLQSVRFSVDEESAYSCIAKAAPKIYSFDDPAIEEKLWGTRKPIITFFFSEVR